MDDARVDEHSYRGLDLLLIALEDFGNGGLSQGVGHNCGEQDLPLGLV
jgi:hypothetical protein